ncbi:MAG: hypothetical protein LBD46_04650 [Endomicrobium sp.]|nr:hypothetical protein [Endomicrobium sp.]
MSNKIILDKEDANIFSRFDIKKRGLLITMLLKDLGYPTEGRLSTDTPWLSEEEYSKVSSAFLKISEKQREDIDGDANDVEPTD